MSIPEISQHTFWSSGSGNILSANNFQGLNKDVVQGKNKIFFNFHRFNRFSDFSLNKPLLSNNGGYVFLNIPFLKVYLRTSFVASTFLL